MLTGGASVGENRIYKTLDDFSNEQIKEILTRKKTDELITLPQQSFISNNPFKNGGSRKVNV